MSTLEKSSTNLVWIDLEMTGLDPDHDVIIELATAVTDAKLEHLVEGPNIVISQSSQRLLSMDEWNTSHHRESGLTQAVLKSEITDKEAESETLKFLIKFISAGHSPMCGNSISTDRQFLRRYMPDLNNFFHYRNIDVSTLKELAKRWQPGLRPFKKSGGHRALSDIKESIEELKYYRQYFLLDS